MEERNVKRNASEIEDVATKWFTYTSETKPADIPNDTLTHLRVAPSVEKIPSRAFLSCKALVHVQLPETLTDIGSHAFHECHSLKFVQFVSEAYLETFSSGRSLEDGTIVFPEMAELRIGEFAFSRCYNLQKVVVCSPSTKLGKGAFCSCRGLLSVELPDGLQVIEEYLLSGCQSLAAIRVPTSVINIREGAFEGCRTLISLEVPEKLTRIGNNAFRNCSKLKCVRLASEDNLEDGSLTVFPETLIEIGDDAFRDCHSLLKVFFCSPSTKLGREVFRGCVGLVSVELPDGLQVIEEYLLSGCESFAGVRIPTSVISIREGAFRGCRSIPFLEFATNGAKGRRPSPTWERMKSFFGCGFKRIEYIDLAVYRTNGAKRTKPSPTCGKISSIFDCGFKRLEYIEVDDIIFWECSSLSHIRLPPSVERIGIHVFSGCSSLISIELPEECSFDINVSGCRSLVNVAGRVSLSGQFSEISRHSKLGRVADSKTGLERRWEHRFDNSPLNKLCYYHSYHSPEDVLLQLRSLMEENPLAATRQLDEFGMTPLHVLSLSQAPNLDMMRALIQGGHPDHIVQYMDSFGSTPMDYLCLNETPNLIRTALQTRFSYSLGSEGLWKSDSMRRAVDAALAVDYSFRRRAMGVVYRKLANNERKDIVSLMELFLWKLKIDEFGLKKEQIADRQNCRIKCGASIVIPHVLRFFSQAPVS